MKEIMECLQFGRKLKKSNQYVDAVRSFAITLHYYSPRAYQFLRSKFSNNLPDPSCIRSWISNCSGFGEICAGALETLKNIADELKSRGKQFICSMSFDEMSIRKHVQWSDAKKKFQGFITFGRKNSNGEIPVANQALAFLITGINMQVSIPIAHFFITKLIASEKAFLIEQIVREITKVGVKLINITFDGDPTNFAACKLLGASFQPRDLRPYFLNPIDQSKVNILLDACHMLKLLRNSLASGKIIEDGNNKKIEWRYFENLERYRVERNFVTHKLTKKHVEWFRNKMTVKYAAQLFSKSVGDSLNYLTKQNCHGFEECEATAKMAYTINDLFDIFNSTFSSSKSKTFFKNALTRTSADEVFKFLDQVAVYLQSLKIDGQNVLKHKKRTGFKGFLLNIVSLKSIYAEWVETEILKELPTYQLSQDPLESLFGRVRSLNGNNDNPNVVQFGSALRKILIDNELKSSKHANCADQLSILKVSSKRLNSSTNLNTNLLISHITSEQNEDENDDVFEHPILNENDILMNCCEEVTIASIGSSIEKKIHEAARFECGCKDILAQNEKSKEVTVSDNCYVPCSSTVYVCKIANICFNQCKNQINFDYQELIERILDMVDLSNVFTTFFVCDDSHKKGFIMYIIEEFIRLQATYIAKNLTLIEQKIMCRNQLKKKIHFLGQ